MPLQFKPNHSSATLLELSEPRALKPGGKDLSGIIFMPHDQLAII